MVRRNYEALVSGDGACAGCGEKSVLRAAASVTEAYMRPLYHKKAARLREKANSMKENGAARYVTIKSASTRSVPPSCIVKDQTVKGNNAQNVTGCSRKRTLLPNRNSCVSQSEARCATLLRELLSKMQKMLQIS